MNHYATIARHSVPNRTRYVEIERVLESGKYLVALRDNEDRIVCGQNYGNLVLVSTDIATEEAARKIASAMWSHCRNHNDVQTIARVVVALSATAAV